ncbi:glycosyltransferase family 39 protein [Vitiosangium sp. GDMCC 1.1324]|uniref:ArnT family glycosyltransferase n=1 Tax=Vitiosangium sp. (strain GDMCC 1.1324) TaxID=2138576 RepID=UPI00130D8A98|nr:glycosyltransferase family 39 protein [Vitiosangium sp. GDMCC 1.1324]
MSAIVTTALVALLPGLNHPGIHNWDEAVHLAVSRGLMDTPLRPHVYAEPFHQPPIDDWINGGLWLHKPLGAMWFAALSMSITGVSTGSARFVSVLGMGAAALGVFFLMRASAGRFWSTIAACTLLVLPFTYELTQGFMFGDMTDTSLAGCLALAMVLLVMSIQRDSLPLAALAGIAVGLGYLCKSTLALTPVGVAAVLSAGRLLKLTAGPTLRQLALLLACAATVALPWSLYAQHAYPDLWAIESHVTRSHLFLDDARKNPSIVMWIRPLDAVFNEIHLRTLEPFPEALPLLAGLWLLYRALRTRELETTAVALWLWPTWLVLSLAPAKVPATSWGAVTAVFCALALLLRDSFRRPVLAAAVVGALSTPFLLPRLAFLAPLRNRLPAALEQTRNTPGLFEGLCLALTLALVVGVLFLVPRARRPLTLGLGFSSAALALYFFVPHTALAHQKMREARRDVGERTNTKEAGLAAAKLLPKQALVWMRMEMDAPEQFEHLNFMFWSGRMAFKGNPRLDWGRAEGYRHYLASPAAEPFASLEVPAGSALRLYDLSVPAPLPELPPGVQHLEVDTGSAVVKGVAFIRTGYARDRWAFFVAPRRVPETLRVTFHLGGGKSETVPLPPEAALRPRAAFRDAAWFIIPTLGPRADQVESIELPGTTAPFPLARGG